LNNKIKDTWYYVVIQNPGISNEHFLGYSNQETETTFVPAFKSKEIAQQCFLLMPKMPKDVMNEKYEIQAIIEDDLIDKSQKNGYEVFLLDEKGSILKKIS